MLATEIAIRWRQSFQPPADLLKVLIDQLEHNLANTPTRLAVAEMHLLHGQMYKAKSEWEMILSESPDVIPALNNLAVVLSRETPPQIDRALELIERADRIKPGDPEIGDSVGEILMAWRKDA